MRQAESLSRREFLERSTVAAAGALVAPLMASAAPGNTPAAAGGKPRLSVCIDALFTQVPFEQRLDLVKAAGVTAFEFWGWRGHDLEALARKKQETGLDLACFCTETGGDLVAPGSKGRFLPALKASLEAAKKLGTKRLIATVGAERKDSTRAEQHARIVEAFKAGAPLCEDAGITIVIEPLNVLVNHKGYYLATSAEGFQIVDEVGSPNVRLLFDVYHQQITEGNLIQNISNNLKRIEHFHVADVPGRHHLGTGEINYGGVFRAIAKKGYSGFVGLEMWPTIDPATAVRQTVELFNQAIAG